MIVCEEAKPCDCQQDCVSANPSLRLQTLGFQLCSETLQETNQLFKIKSRYFDIFVFKNGILA